jgi:multicomponent Na+:H+ antiporter subunit G
MTVLYTILTVIVVLGGAFFITDPLLAAVSPLFSQIMAVILMLCGVFFMIVSCIGLLRLPDFYNRNHAVGKSETMGTILILFGLMVYYGWALTSLKIFFILLFIGVANPTATHATLRAAFCCGLQPWTLKDKQTGKNLEPKREEVTKL